MVKKKSIIVTMLITTMLAAALTGCKKNDTKNEKKNAEKVDYEKIVTLGEYKGVSLKTADIDAEVKTTTDSMLENYVTYEKVTKGKVNDGDVVNINYVGKIDGKEFEGGNYNAKDHPDGYDLTIGSGSFIEGFESGLIGKKIGDTVDLKLKFPDDYKTKEVAGKDVVFTVNINSKQGEKIMPEINDEFVKENLKDYSSAKDYQDKVRLDAKKKLSWEKVTESSKVSKLPDSLLDANKKRMKKSVEYYLKQQGSSLEKYLKSQNMSEKDFESDLEETAKNTVKDMCIYEAIAAKENIKVSDADYKEEAENIKTSNNLKDDKALDELFNNYYGEKAEVVIKENLLNEKVQEFIANNVKEESEAKSE